ncbi:hypothetical protein [Dyadobacter sp. NIV53]|uniref:hypothetical protein n=1 Tax=Dyadobacter sp. NIV53 TaxID=2861765 RepID=UPI001C887F03|nr:hypothetical protein [Dyadobacter sp. NIV53]
MGSKTISVFFLLEMIWSLSNCSDIKNAYQWEDVTIDADLSKDLIYKQLDKEKEIFSMFEEQDSLTRRTSDVSYFSGKKIDLSHTRYAKYNNCRAYYYNPDTLSINIGFGDGYSGRGFIIDYIDKKFHTQAYHSTDVIIVGEVKPTHKIVYQKLTLDKADYAVGDSLFGKVEFKSMEQGGEGEKTEHFGKGSFRTKISKF